MDTTSRPAARLPKPRIRRTPWGEYNLEMSDGYVVAGPFIERSWAEDARDTPEVQAVIARWANPTTTAR